MFSGLDILQYWIYKGKLVKNLCFFSFAGLHYIHNQRKCKPFSGFLYENKKTGTPAL